MLGCNQFVTKEMYPADLQKHPELAEQPEVMCRGGSAIISPLGEVIAGPLYDEEGILYAELDMGEIVRAKVDFDVVGHYARPDVFQLLVNEEANPAGAKFVGQAYSLTFSVVGLPSGMLRESPTYMIL